MADQPDIATTAATQFKTCNRCVRELPLRAFEHHKGKCKDCLNEKRRERNKDQTYRERRSAYRREYASRAEVAERRKKRMEDPEYIERLREGVRKWRRKTSSKEHVSATGRVKRRSPSVKSRMLVASAKYRAEKFSLPFDLDFDWVLEKVMAGRCELSGVEFDFERPVEGVHHNPLSPSIDQIKPQGGYTKSNCRVILTGLNRSLSDWGESVFEKMAVSFLRHRGFLVSPPD